MRLPTDDPSADSAADAPAPLRAVLWDMDGTLVDTEPYWITAERELVERFGGQWGHEQAMRLVGQALTTSARLLQNGGVVMGEREIIDTLTARVIEQLGESVPWRPGAREMLAALRAEGVHCALVTMSEAPMARRIVDHLPEDTFAAVVTGDAVTRGKPDPEPYARGIELLAEGLSGLAVSECLAVEDSTPGATSATAAGLATVVVPNALAVPVDLGVEHWPTLAGRSPGDLASALDRALAAASAGGTA
ncbi:HAD family hydrolase [Sinomonas notoginsengisoli]|uniref:HAD family hydrolase n=1 Tax=Sinomonas notoginsengisoli TaxID=1457311 RepID=UPI001F362DC2|nr:HAD family phosphatase [Sinomonas notoginsengisoli]